VPNVASVISLSILDCHFFLYVTDDNNKFSMIGDSYTLKDEAEDAGITYV
jgi:hypothetical protein